MQQPEEDIVRAVPPSESEVDELGRIILIPPKRQQQQATPEEVNVDRKRSRSGSRERRHARGGSSSGGEGVAPPPHSQRHSSGSFPNRNEGGAPRNRDFREDRRDFRRDADGGWGKDKGGWGQDKGGWGEDKGGWGEDKGGWGEDKGGWGQESSRDIDRDTNSGRAQDNARGWGRDDGRERERYGGRGRGGRGPPRSESGAGRYVSNELIAERPVHFEPLQSFKNFMLHQSDDASPEEFKRRYDDYQTVHMVNFSRHFFHSNKATDWFRERYDPSKRQEQAEDAAAWAQAESAEFHRSLASDTAGMLQACSLDIPPASSNSASTGTAPLSGKHLSGHVGCAVRLSGIPHQCSKQALKTALLEALPTLQRVVLSQPVWASGFRFERTGWVVMPTVEAASEAATVLQHFPVKVLSPPHDQTGEQTLLFTFFPEVQMHSPSGGVLLPPDMGSPSRISFDVARAIELGGTFDEARNIPFEHGLASVLELVEDSQLCARSPSLRLDVVLAYLRRVHLISYYAAVRFRDEAHLLAIAADVIYRQTATDSGVSDVVVMTEADMRYDELIRSATYKSAEASADDRDAQLIVERSAQVLDKWVSDNMLGEPDGKARCGVQWCSKLFRGTDFLQKHLLSKHAHDCNAGPLLAIAEPLMWTRFDSEDISARPLPPIEVESTSGLEMLSVADVMAQMKMSVRYEYDMLQPQPPERPPPPPRRYQENRAPADRPRRTERSDRRQTFPSTADVVRPLVKYLDVDAPKATVPSLDYGPVTAPPPKRRKLAMMATKVKSEDGDAANDEVGGP